MAVYPIDPWSVATAAVLSLYAMCVVLRMATLS